MKRYLIGKNVKELRKLSISTLLFDMLSIIINYPTLQRYLSYESP